MSDVVVIGDSCSVWFFKALGFRVEFTDGKADISQLVEDVLGRQCKLLFVTEDVYVAMGELLDAQSKQAGVVVSVIPSLSSKRGIGQQRLRAFLRTAVGAELAE